MPLGEGGGGEQGAGVSQQPTVTVHAGVAADTARPRPTAARAALENQKDAAVSRRVRTRGATALASNSLLGASTHMIRGSPKKPTASAIKTMRVHCLSLHISPFQKRPDMVAVAFPLLLTA